MKGTVNTGQHSSKILANTSETAEYMIPLT